MYWENYQSQLYFESMFDLHFLKLLKTIDRLFNKARLNKIFFKTAKFTIYFAFMHSFIHFNCIFIFTKDVPKGLEASQKQCQDLDSGYNKLPRKLEFKKVFVWTTGRWTFRCRILRILNGLIYRYYGTIDKWHKNNT